MNKTLIYKKVGSTPLQAIEEFRKKNPIFGDKKISYAGRLDPMAEGLLLILIGEENKNRSKYEGLDKRYEAEIVLGITTDTYDSLGIVKKIDLRKVQIELLQGAISLLPELKAQSYPPYSSKTVGGKPLYWWSRANRLDEIEIPKRKISIYGAKILKTSSVRGRDVVEDLLPNIQKVQGDFRQEEVIRGWESFKSQFGDVNFFKLKIEIYCSSGTYIRGLANTIGEEIGTGGFCTSIKRTNIGGYSVLDFK